MKFSFYNTRHYSRCIQIIQSNTPEFIHPDEHREYEKFLREEKIYYVLSLNSKIIACGGIWVNSDQSKSGLSWGLVDRQYHGMGIGKKLLKYRLNQIKEKYPRSTIRCETSQHTYKFFGLRSKMRPKLHHQNVSRSRPLVSKSAFILPPTPI